MQCCVSNALLEITGWIYIWKQYKLIVLNCTKQNLIYCRDDEAQQETFMARTIRSFRSKPKPGE